MRPKVIYLIRHGESEGNVNRSLYKNVPDFKLHLTDKGKRQAAKMAREIAREIPRTEPIRIYCSPYYRTRETAAALQKIFKKVTYREDPRIREQEWGNFMEDGTTKKIDAQRNKFGTFLYRIPGGESGADVYDRISGFLDTAYRSFENSDHEEVVFVVSHGFCLRILLMRWFHWTIEEFERVKNLRNCDIVKLVLNDKNRFGLVTPLRKRPYDRAIQR